MVVDFSKIDLQQAPVLILKNTSEIPIGVLGYAYNVTPDIKYNETSVLEFTVPYSSDGEKVPFYDDIFGMRIVELQDVGQFILVNPKESGDGIKKYKTCKAYSLEYEFTFKKLTLEKGTYNFWNPVASESSILGIILELMPSWKVGQIDSSLIGKYRTFEVSDENLYDFIKNTAQKSYNCIFDFDTFNRTVNVKDVSSTVATNPVYISVNNLAKNIDIEEDTESIITRLDINGADGVNVRDVNPSGTNTIVNLDYFMTESNFDKETVEKYFLWKETYENYQLTYYNLSVDYSLKVMRRTTEKAALTELEGELTVLENEQGVTIQSIARGLMTQSDLNEINAKIAAKQFEINMKNTEIGRIEVQIQDVYNELADINKAVDLRSFFTEEEYLLIDRYLKDGSVSESSFVATETKSYSDADTGAAIENGSVHIENAIVARAENFRGMDLYDIRGGYITVGSVRAELISAVAEIDEENSLVMTAYLSSGTTDGTAFKTACISLTGTADFAANDNDQMLVEFSSGYLYFTYNTSEYEKRAVAWELYEYGKEILEKMAFPSYSFKVTSGNFLYLEDFVSFKNSVNQGEKIYLSIGEDKTLSPILIGVKYSYEEKNSLTLEFGDTYSSADSSFRLADLLEQSISMGKKVDLSKFTYSAFIDSGANTQVKEFINSSLDVSKNAILSSKDQAISWTEAGIRLRKWTDDSHTGYEPQQIWMNNNSILMTKDNWATAELAIGYFNDPNLGQLWGIVAPNIVGTLLAGSNLVIESVKKDGGVSVFKVDADGCKLHNSDFSITSEKNNTHILLDAEHGIAIGTYPLIDENGGINEDNYKFWVSEDGDLFFKGTIYANDGEFTGKITATEGYIGGETGWAIGSNAIYNGKTYLNDYSQGVYIGTDGIHLGNGATAFKVTNYGYMTANSGSIAGLTMSNGAIYSGFHSSLDDTYNPGFYIDSNGGFSVSSAGGASYLIFDPTFGTLSFKGTLDDPTGLLDGENVTFQNITVGSLKAGESGVTFGTVAYNDATVFNLQSTVGDYFYLGDYTVAIHGADQHASADKNGIVINGKSESMSMNISARAGYMSGSWYSTSETAVSSDRNKKNSIEALDGRYEDFFDLLSAKRFKYNDGTSDRFHTGFIAQEVETALATAGIGTEEFSGFVRQKGDGTEELFLRYENFISLNTWQIQKLKQKISELEAKIEAMNL